MSKTFKIILERSDSLFQWKDICVFTKCIYPHLTVKFTPARKKPHHFKILLQPQSVILTAITQVIKYCVKTVKLSEKCKQREKKTKDLGALSNSVLMDQYMFKNHLQH